MSDNQPNSLEEILQVFKQHSLDYQEWRQSVPENPESSVYFDLPRALAKICEEIIALKKGEDD